MSLTPLARLFYVSLWCEADREGRLEWKPRTLKMRYLPADECDVEAIGQELVRAGVIDLYEADGKTYAQIPGFKKHQVINNREAPSTIPEPKTTTRDDASVTRESGRKEGREGKGKEDASKDDANSCAPEASPIKTTRIGLLCKRIRQDAKLMGVNPMDPRLIALLESGYTDDEIFAVCSEAAEGQKSWPWAFTVVQARKAEAGGVKQAPKQDRNAMFRGAI